MKTNVEKIALEISPRTESGSNYCKRIRANGLLPGIIYGGSHETLPITLSMEKFQEYLRHPAKIVNLVLGKETLNAVIKEVQYDSLGEKIIHIDFYRIQMDQMVTVSIPIKFQGIAKGTLQGGVLEQQSKSVDIECLPSEVPQELLINIENLEIGQILRIKDIPLPPSIKIKQDPELAVAKVKKIEEEGVAPVAPSEGKAEPELIGGRKEEEGGEEN